MIVRHSHKWRLNLKNKTCILSLALMFPNKLLSPDDEATPHISKNNFDILDRNKNRNVWYSPGRVKNLNMRVCAPMFFLMFFFTSLINKQLKNRFDQIHLISCFLKVMYWYSKKSSHKRKIWKAQVFTGLLFNYKLLSFNSAN